MHIRTRALWFPHVAQRRTAVMNVNALKLLFGSTWSPGGPNLKNLRRCSRGIGHHRPFFSVQPEPQVSAYEINTA